MKGKISPACPLTSGGKIRPQPKILMGMMSGRERPVTLILSNSSFFAATISPAVKVNAAEVPGMGSPG